MSTSPSSASPQVNAAYYDGQTAASRAVVLSVDGSDLVLRGASFELRWPLHEVQVSERLGSTPRLLAHAVDGHCEVSDQAGLEKLLAQTGKSLDWLERMQHSLPWALAAVVLLVVSFAAAYRYLLPWGAEVLALRMPDAVLQKMGSSTLEALDKFALKPSKLDAARQQELADEFERLQALPDTRFKYRIIFRSAPEMGANAFALPDGTIVMLDELVALTPDDNEIIAVLEHERGHVERRHAMRMVLQSSAVGLVMTWYLGDVSSLLAAAPAIIAQAKYSRDMEREADEYAERALQLNALSPCLLATILDKLEAAHLAAMKTENQPPVAGPEKHTATMDYLSSHPATQERIGLLCPAR
ncbi:MAG: M48 family metallopeptidase [Nitrosomonadales bacterium]|nr:M48 family metallopeptidase [Nitrosomonadales bacterium]